LHVLRSVTYCSAGVWQQRFLKGYAADPGRAHEAACAVATEAITSIRTAAAFSLQGSVQEADSWPSWQPPEAKPCPGPSGWRCLWVQPGILTYPLSSTMPPITSCSVLCSNQLTCNAVAHPSKHTVL